MHLSVDYLQLPDQLLAVAFPHPLHRESKGQKLQPLQQKAATLLLESWEYEPNYTVPGIHLATVYSCLPSINTVASSKTHDIDIARAVTANLQDLTDHIFSANIIAGLDQHPQKMEVIGKLSETAILGTLWWGIANGYRDARSYMLPSTRQEDHGISKDGYLRGTDIIMRHSGVKGRQLIQVKTTLETEKNCARYHPEVAILTPAELTWLPSKGPRKLLKALSENEHSVLADANYKADVVLQETRDRALEYRKSKSRSRVQLLKNKENHSVVGEEGIEPSLRKEHDFESCAYTSSATRPLSHGVA